MSTHRLAHLDVLRVLAFGLLIPYHVGMYYVGWDWHVKSPASELAGALLEPFMLLPAPWRLSLLFFVAGAVAQGLLQRRGAAGYAGERSARLLLPLLFGMAVVVVPQAYFEVKTKAPHLLAGGYLDFWWHYLQGGRYCRGSDCMRVPTWNHLWFLPYLWLYAMLMLPLARSLPSLRSPRWPPARALAGGTWWLLPALPLLLWRLAVMPHFPTTHDLVHDLYNHLHYGTLFLYGWLSRSDAAAGFWAQALRWRWPLLLAATLAWGLRAEVYISVADPSPALRSGLRTLWALQCWWGIAAACGFAQRWFPADRPAPRWLQQAAAASFCLYVLHQTVIVLLTQALAPLAWPWPAEAAVLAVLTIALSVAGYLLARHVPGLRLLLGIAAPRRRLSAAPAAA